VGKLVPGIVALERRFLQLLEFSRELRRVGRRCRAITLRKCRSAN
jgi:hypothetical protein